MAISKRSFVTSGFLLAAACTLAGCGGGDAPAGAPAAAAPSGPMLKLEIPAMAYDGTPRGRNPDIKFDKMETLTKQTFPVPEGCKNLALNKKVTASDDPFRGELKEITDGNKENAGDNFEVVEINSGKIWVQIDLEKSAALYAVAIWHIHKDKRVFTGVIVQASDDPDFVKGVTTLYNNDQLNTNGMGVGSDMGYEESRYGKVIQANGVKARYVRVYGHGSNVDDNNQFSEVEVWGVPAN